MSLSVIAVIGSKIPLSAAIFIGAGLLTSVRTLIAQNDSDPTSDTRPAKDLATGWSLLKEGEAEGTIEQDAKHPASTNPHLLRIAVTKTATPGNGRVGATNRAAINVHEGQWCYVTFSAVTERGSIALVFSLEGADGKVLARTTLPEIGRGRPGAGGSGGASAHWMTYTVSLHARGSDPNAHLVITPIEPTSVWLDGLTLTSRTTAP